MVYVCLHVYRSLCDCVHGMGRPQLGQGERFFKPVLFSRPHEQAWPTTLSCSEFCSGPFRMSRETKTCIPRSFQAPLQGFLLENQANNGHLGKITKFSPRRTHCKLWVCIFGWEVECTGNDAENIDIWPARNR